VNPSHHPDTWNLPVVFLVSSVLAGVALVSSLILLWACLTSWENDGVFDALGLDGLSYGQVTTIVYLKVHNEMPS
jgi:H+-transporting ATPase